MRKSKLMNWVVKPAISEVYYYGDYPTFTLADFWSKKMAFKTIINVTDYYTNMTEFDNFYASAYSGSTEYRPGWYSPLIICALDSDNHFWSFDSFFDNVVDWTDQSGLTIPTTQSEIETFLINWHAY